ncbi:MAG: UDP-N-acetylmuramoyl-tripeptide--D-alanyl-D-alanine ligase [Bacteroidota bacterium]|nr:UDP-N-acetylmuramoyl-tripeptide--D-alanyl-D-alanine ligase [Bacteroidota bacterium]
MVPFEAFLMSSGVTTDSRNIPNNSIFFALKGERFNGNEYALKALDSGAKFAIVDEGIFHDSRIIKVANVLESLQDCARSYRRHLGIPIIGLTGSNGKTTCKELFRAVLSKKYEIFATKGNFNNHIGVPLSLLNIPRNSDIAIIEMGANHQNEIALLSSICEPNIGYITNFGKAHLEGFGGVEGVIKGKSELYDYLRKTKQKAMVSFDDVLQMNNSEGIQTFGFGQNAGLITWAPSSSSEFARINIFSEHSSYSVQSLLSGSFNEQNIAAAACIGHYYKVAPNHIKEAIESYVPKMNRVEWRTTESNKVLLDAYNANPSSMKLSIDSFSKWHRKDGILILGDMFELGEASAFEHQSIVDYLIALNLQNQSILIGRYFSATDWVGAKFESTEALADYWKEKGAPRDASILLKGSRVIALETLMNML